MALQLRAMATRSVGGRPPCERQGRRITAVQVRAAGASWKPKLPGGDSTSDPYKTNLGIYQGHASPSYFPPPKTGRLELESSDGRVGFWSMSHAQPWFLQIVSATHYLAFVTQLAVAAAYYANGAALGATLPVLLVLGPLMQAAGGAGPNVMHEYEGFEVAPFAAYPEKDPATQRPEQNNDALRQVAYRSLFQLQAIGGAMVGLGALWPAAWPSSGAWALLGALGVANYLAPRNCWYGRFSLGGKVELLLPPLPVWPLVLFAVGAGLELFGLCHLFGPGLGIGITLLLSAGGLLEAGLAEGSYDQRWHLFAVVLLNGGGVLQVAAINSLWSNPIFQAVMAAVVLGVSVMMLPPGGAVPDRITKLNSDPPLEAAGESAEADAQPAVSAPVSGRQ